MGTSISHGATLRDTTPLGRAQAGTSGDSDLPLECPVAHRGSSTRDDAINPLNRMPELSQGRVPGQKVELSIERTISTIPKLREGSSDASACPVAGPSSSSKVDDGNWVYPSPQQFHNALVRKGKAAPEESVSMMVAIHNWLNESAWQEIRRWESRRPNAETPELARFEGRPDDLSPKARIHLVMSKFFPNHYQHAVPFDRHDWQIYRPLEGSMQRYVIDYYACPNDAQGNPVFSLDVRPAVDSPTALLVRLRAWSRMKQEGWFGGSGSQTVLN